MSDYNADPLTRVAEEETARETAPLPFVDEREAAPEPEEFEIFEPASAAETFKLSAVSVQTALIALVFLVIGFVAGALIFGNIEATVRAVVIEEIARAGVGGATGVNMTVLADDDPSLGPDNAPVQIVEFSDFYCSFCTRFATSTFFQLQERYGDLIQFTYRDLPIIGGQDSFEAAIAGNCAHQQGKFWEFHNIVFAHPDARGRDTYFAFAEELGMNTGQFTACYDEPATADEVTLDYLDGVDLGITGTPLFFINGRKVSGAQPFNTFMTLIDNELEKAGITPPPRVQQEE